MPRSLGNRLHLVEESSFAAPERVGICISRRVGLCGGGGSFDLGSFFGLELFRRPLPTFVVGVRRGGKELLVLVADDSLDIDCLRLRPLSFHGCAVHFQAARKGLDRRKETLLQADHEEARSCLHPTRSACEALLTRSAIFVEQAGERELGGVFWELADHHAIDDALGKPALYVSNVLLKAAHHHIFERPFSPNLTPRVKRYGSSSSSRSYEEVDSGQRSCRVKSLNTDSGGKHASCSPPC